MTPFTDIYDKSLICIQDYKLEELAKKDYDSFLLFMKGLLVNSIDFFNYSLTDLSFKDVEEETEDGNIIVSTYFENDLSSKEQSILAMIVVREWFLREIQDIRQFNLHLTTRDFKIMSEANNLKQKSEYLDKLNERIYQEIQKYEIANMDKIVGDYYL